MTAALKAAGAGMPPHASSPHFADHDLIEKLLDRLPGRVQTAARWLRRPSSRWVRVPAGVLLLIGGVIGMLPLFGFWMLPLGLMLLTEDVRLLRRARNRIIERIARRHPDWFTAREAAGPPVTSVPTPSSAPPDTRSRDTQS